MVAKAYDLLAQQPVSVIGFSPENWGDIVVSAITDDAGNAHVLSRIKDNRWDLSPFFDQSNVQESRKWIEWPVDCPQTLVDACKAAFYIWFKRGRPGV